MKYVLVEDGVVVQIDCNPRVGFIEAEDCIVCGMLYDGDNFSPPKAQPVSILKQILALEAELTNRTLREALAGQAFALNKIAEIDSAIKLLRDQL